MVEIIGTTRYTAENPTLSPYVVPIQPIRSPLLLANPTAAQIRTLADKNNLLKIDWEVVRGFRRGVSKKIRDTLDLEFFELLQYARYNYLKVLPQKYITNLKMKHSLINVNTIAELKAHYNRGWEYDENLIQSPKRLNKEQASLQLDGITINKDDKFSHYLRELYRSGTFTDETMIE